MRQPKKIKVRHKWVIEKKSLDAFSFTDDEEEEQKPLPINAKAPQLMNSINEPFKNPLNFLVTEAMDNAISTVNILYNLYNYSES